MRKKALSPAARREAAQRLSSSGACSARAACRILTLARSTYRYRGRGPTAHEEALHGRLRELSEKHPRYGYRRIAALLRQEGWKAGKRLAQRWMKDNGVKTLYIEPGSPWQNGFVESFHGRFRDECLNREQLHTLTEARVVIEDYRREYNQRRRHSRLGYLSPESFAQTQLPSPVAVGLRPPSTGDGQTNAQQQSSTND